MAGIYVHIPFCKQACHYCDFHFSTTLSRKDEMIRAIAKELELRKNELAGQNVETIYFGGGTPSLLTVDEIETILATISAYYQVVNAPEITLEANPDDLSKAQLQQLSKTTINRLSIGVQSFFERDLRFMNRAHNAHEAKASIMLAKEYFKNISIDLIYGVPDASDKDWMSNIDTALSFEVQHISSYALTVEPKTALAKFIEKGVAKNVDDEQAQRQFYLLVDALEAHDYVHYELSNFGKSGYFSKNNSAYWQGKSYLGVGPSAHSFDGSRRSWNVNNNPIYIKKLTNNELACTSETLSATDRYNETIMTGLRTMWGISLAAVETTFGATYKKYLLQQAAPFIKQQLLYIEDDKLLTTKKGKFLSDGISSDLFKLNLQ